MQSSHINLLITRHSVRWDSSLNSNNSVLMIIILILSSIYVRHVYIYIIHKTLNCVYNNMCDGNYDSDKT